MINVFLVNLKKLINNRRALKIPWMRIWFLLVPMPFLVRLDNNISDIIVMFMLAATLLITFVTISRVAGNSFSDSSPKIKENEKNFASEEESKEVILIIIFVERVQGDYDYTDFSESEYPSDYEEEYLMDYVHYPFQDIDLGVKFINGFETEAPSLDLSLGKVFDIDRDTNGEILWVWVQIQLYNPTPMPSPLEPTQCILRCTLSEDLRAHPISEGDFVLLEYRRRAYEENFLNRTFTIIKIEKENN